MYLLLFIKTLHNVAVDEYWIFKVLELIWLLTNRKSHARLSKVSSKVLLWKAKYEIANFLLYQVKYKNFDLYNLEHHENVSSVASKNVLLLKDQHESLKAVSR